jgi:hypothetical protein
MHNNLRRLRERAPIKRARCRLCSAFRTEGCKSFAATKEILADRGISHASYAVVEKTTGSRLATLVATIGAFSMTRITAANFQIDPPANDPVPLAG